MDWLTFFVGMAKALAWPVVVFVFLFLIRKRLGDLLGRLIELTFPGGSIKFESQLALIEKTAERAEQQVISGEVRAEPLTKKRIRTTGSRPIAGATDPLIELAQVSPEGAVLTAFEEVEVALWELLPEDDEIDLRIKFIRLARKYKRVGGTMNKWFVQLQDSRNAIVHRHTPITVSEAIQYVDQAKRFIESVTVLLQKPQSPTSPPLPRSPSDNEKPS
jgi:hypothetical protein